MKTESGVSPSLPAAKPFAGNSLLVWAVFALPPFLEWGRLLTFDLRPFSASRYHVGVFGERTPPTTSSEVNVLWAMLFVDKVSMG